MIESAAPLKRIQLVTFTAINGEAGEGMTWISGVIKIRSMTAIARCGGSGVQAIRSSGMAFLAVERSMHAEERKPRRLVSLDHVSDFPRLERVASNAIRSELRFVDVDMTRRADLTGKLERKILVTTYARCGLVPSFKRESGGGVIERHIRPHLPRIGRVTLLAWDRKLSVRRCLAIAQAHACKCQTGCNEHSDVHFTP